MATTRGGGGSASRVGDGDVDLGEGWNWGAIPRLISSACLFLCSGWVPPPSLTFLFARRSFSFSSGCSTACDPRCLGRGRRTVGVNRLLLAGARLWPVDCGRSTWSAECVAGGYRIDSDVLYMESFYRETTGRFSGRPRMVCLGCRLISLGFC